MRSCIYCGKELAKDEVCSCSLAVAARKGKNPYAQTKSKTENDHKTKKQNHTAYDSDKNTYRTGYTKHDNPIKDAWNKYGARKQAARSHSAKAKKQPRRNIIFDTLSFIKSPITTVYNPGHMSASLILTISALSGALISLCSYLLFMRILNSPAEFLQGALHTMTSIIHSAVLFGGAAAVIVGAIGGIVMFLIYSGVFYFMNKFIFGYHTNFWDFSTRLVLCPLPIAIISIPGLIFGLISPITIAIFMICGTICMVILTYETLKTEWSSQSPNKILYAALLGFFIIGIILSNLVWLT